MNKKIAQNWYYVIAVIIAALLVLHYTGVFKKMLGSDDQNTENTAEVMSQEQSDELRDEINAELQDTENFKEVVSAGTLNTTGFTTTKTGLMYKPVSLGSGTEKPTATSQVTVHYTGTLADGTVFDSSVERGTPATFGLDQVITGWTEGLQLMNKGDVYDFIIPSDLAYGPSGSGHQLSGKALQFRVELIDIN